VNNSNDTNGYAIKSWGFRRECGKRHLPQVIEHESAPRVQFEHDKMILQVRPGANENKKQSVIDAAYRRELKAPIPPASLSGCVKSRANRA